MKIYYKFTIFALITLYFALLSSAAFAATVELEVPLPGLTGNSLEADPGLYINRIFVFGLSLAGFLAVAAMAYGGIQYMLAGTSIGSVQDAKKKIIGALGGIGLLLLAYLLLFTIDPSLVKLTPKINPLNKILKPKENAYYAPPGTKNCEPACTNGFRCDAQTYKCVKIEVTAPELIKNQTPGECQEFETVPSGCTKIKKVWNPNTCQCDLCSGSYKWDNATKNCILK